LKERGGNENGPFSLIKGRHGGRKEKRREHTLHPPEVRGKVSVRRGNRYGHKKNRENSYKTRGNRRITKRGKKGPRKFWTLSERHGTPLRWGRREEMLFTFVGGLRGKRSC